MRYPRNPILTIDPPRANWLPVRFTLGSTVHEVVASSVLNDPLRDLVVALRGLLRGDNDRSVHFWEEEPTTILQFVVDDDREELTLRLFQTERTELEIVDGTPLGSMRLPFRKGSRHFIEILEGLDEPEFLAVHEREWNREFPRELTRECRALWRETRSRGAE